MTALSNAYKNLPHAVAHGWERAIADAWITEHGAPPTLALHGRPWMTRHLLAELLARVYTAAREDASESEGLLSRARECLRSYPQAADPTTQTNEPMRLVMEIDEALRDAVKAVR